MKSSATFWTRFLKADEVSTSCQRRHQARHSHPKDRPLKQLTYVRHSKNPVIFRGRLVGLLVLGALTPTTPIAAQKTASPPAIDASPPSSWRVPPAELQALTFRELGPFRGGRVTTVTGVAQEPPTFYFGGTGGGVALDRSVARPRERSTAERFRSGSPREALLRLGRWIGTLGCWDGRVEVAERLRLSGRAAGPAPSV